jgi:lipoprotein
MKLATRIAVPLVAVAALTGCAHNPSTAAIVGDRVISDAELTEIVDSCRAEGLKPNRSKVVSLMVFGEIFEGAAQRLGESLDDAALQAMKRDPQLAPLVGTPCEKPFKNGFRMEIGKKVLDPGSVKASLPSVEINPRYGAWDPEQGFDPMGGSISVEAES